MNYYQCRINIPGVAQGFLVVTAKNKAEAEKRVEEYVINKTKEMSINFIAEEKIEKE